MIDPDEIYGTIIPAWRGPELTWKPRDQIALFVEDPLYPIPTTQEVKCSTHCS
jgi:hypothetical protein